MFLKNARFLAAFIAITLTWTPVNASVPPKTMVIVWDGIRAYERDNPTYAPEFNGYVRGQGAFVDGILDAEGCCNTSTPFGHSTWSSGTCQRLNGDISGETHSTMPLWHEYWASQYGYDPTKFMVVSGKLRCQCLIDSWHGEYNGLYPASFTWIEHPWFEGWDGNDEDVAAAAMSLIAANHPDFVWVVFAETDRVAHRAQGDYDRWIEAVGTTDHWVRVLFDFGLAQGYENIIVLTDHGRHNDEERTHGPGARHEPETCDGCLLTFAQLLDNEQRVASGLQSELEPSNTPRPASTEWLPTLSHAIAEKVTTLAARGLMLYQCADGDTGYELDLGPLGGWQNHGNGCSGCEAVFFWVYGPGVITGMATEICEPIDLLPTMVALMGQQVPAAQLVVPYAQGRVLSSIFLTPPTTSVATPATQVESWGRMKGLFR